MTHLWQSVYKTIVNENEKKKNILLFQFCFFSCKTSIGKRVFCCCIRTFSPFILFNMSYGKRGKTRRRRRRKKFLSKFITLLSLNKRSNDNLNSSDNNNNNKQYISKSATPPPPPSYSFYIPFHS